jgi:hypothetical protein
MDNLEKIQNERLYHRLINNLISIEELNEKDCIGLLNWLSINIERCEAIRDRPSNKAYHAAWKEEMEDSFNKITQKAVDELVPYLKLQKAVKDYYHKMDFMSGIDKRDRGDDHFNSLLIYYVFRAVKISLGDDETLNKEKFAIILAMLKGKDFSNPNNLYEKKIVSQWPNFLEPAKIRILYERLIDKLLNVGWPELAEIVKLDLDQIVKKPK